MKPTLLILAAGMGSRYGGLKQLDQMGPNGETIMDYSVRYALESGFGKVVIVIRRSMEDDFKQYILPRYADKIPVTYVFQELDILPEGFTVNPERQKPYGTAHAILVAREAIQEPFTVINADDFYGRQAFEVMADFLSHSAPTVPPTYAMVGYRLDRTLSRNGTVSRGVCQTNAEGYLTDIVENHKIGYTDKGIENIEEGLYNLFTGEEPVSMNFWGFTPDFFQALEEQFVDFMRENHDNIKAEYPIPNVIAHLMSRGEARVKVLHSDAEWFGVTYKEDRPYVVERLAQLPD
ncbi:MAG: NTP transferase domain-containing protein [Bacteroidales bacterium]|nr:NTP transferase domain-containing protein [Bacteroidales bacterium]